MLKLKFLLFILLYLFLQASAFSADIYFARVVRIDDNNVIHIIRGDLIRMISLGYVTTPIKGETFHPETHAYLTQHLQDKWVRITELSYGVRSLVKPALVRTPDLTLVNTHMLKKGFAIPNMMTNPPKAILDTASIAKEAGVGIWSKIDLFAQQRENSSQSGIKDMMTGMIVGARKGNEAGVQPYISERGSKIAYPLKCLPYLDNVTVHATQYVVKNKGLSISMKCPKT
jgi:endonuclease YncB( thermonuclease family)